MKRLLLILITLLPLAVQAGPQQVIEEFHSALLEFSQSDVADFDQRFALLEPVVEGTHDLDYISRLTLGRHWRGLEPQQREAFTTRFARLAIANYTARFPQFSGESFEIVEQTSQPRGIELVRTRLNRPDETALEFDYMLRETESGWRIVNILVNGVSDLALKRAEYSSLLAEGSMSGLLETLDRQYTRLSSAD